MSSRDMYARSVFVALLMDIIIGYTHDRSNFNRQSNVRRYNFSDFPALNLPIYETLRSICLAETPRS